LLTRERAVVHPKFFNPKKRCLKNDPKMARAPVTRKPLTSPAPLAAQLQRAADVAQA